MSKRQSFQRFVALTEGLRAYLEEEQTSETISGPILGGWFEKINKAFYEFMPADWEHKYPEIEELMCRLEPDVDISHVLLRKHNVTSLNRHPKVIDQDAFYDRLVDRQQEQGLQLPYCGEMDKTEIVEILDHLLIALNQITLVGIYQGRGEQS